MKKKKILWSGVSLLIVAVLAIMAFVRGRRPAAPPCGSIRRVGGLVHRGVCPAISA